MTERDKPSQHNGAVSEGGQLPAEVRSGRAEGITAAREARREDVHRPQTRAERIRNRLEAAPQPKIFLLMLIVSWLFLTVFTSLDTRMMGAFGVGVGTNYEIGNVSRESIYSPRAVSYVDPVATEEARQRAADSVPITYQEDTSVPSEVSDSVARFFGEVRQIKSSEAPTEEKISQVSGAAPFFLTEDLARLLVSFEDEEVDEAHRYVTENIEELYGSVAVADDSIEEVPAAVIRLSEARNRLSEAAGLDASGELRRVTDLLSRGFIEPDYVVDREATETARERAAAQVGPVTGVVQQGERIVARGEVIDQVDLAKLEALGLAGSSNPWTVFLGVGIVIATEMWILWYFLERFGQRVLKTNPVSRVLLACLLLVLFTALARLFMVFSFNPYLIPLAGFSILGTILIGPRLMFLLVVITSVNVGIIGGDDFFLAAALLLSSGFAIYTVLKVGPRTELLRAGLLIAVVMAVVMFAVALMGGGGLRSALWQGALGFGNGLLSLMLAMVLLPLLENAFNILTPMKLLELSDPGNPLLQKLLRGAPGTFAHSMQVGNLAENAAERIGANALLARVGAYYHDIGKLEHPSYYIENQISRMNPHSTLSPSLSARVIKRHVKDGIEIGHAWNLPRELLDMIVEHHGTTRIEYFYRKALQDALANGGSVGETDFRYPGPRPKSKEAGILMIADSVEATVKSVEKPTPKRVEDIVDTTIQQKLEDGQFDKCELTMQEIHATGEAILEALIGILGPRIKYPDAAPASSSKVEISAVPPREG